MLEKKDLKPSSTEEWARALEGRGSRDLKPDEYSIFYALVRQEEYMEMDEGIDQTLSSWNGAAIFYNRVKEYHTYTVTKAVAFFIGIIIINPAMSTMYANYLQYKCFKAGIRRVDMRVLHEHLLCRGVFREDVLREEWDAQKVRDAVNQEVFNLLDYTPAMESIRNIPAKEYVG